MCGDSGVGCGSGSSSHGCPGCDSVMAFVQSPHGHPLQLHVCPPLPTCSTTLARLVRWISGSVEGGSCWNEASVYSRKACGDVEAGRLWVGMRHANCNPACRVVPGKPTLWFGNLSAPISTTAPHRVQTTPLPNLNICRACKSRATDQGGPPCQAPHGQRGRCAAAPALARRA